MTHTLLSALVNGVIVSVAGTLGMALCLHFVRRSTLNASTRYGIWFVALLLAVGLPLLFIPIPPTQIPIPTVPRLGELPLDDLSREQLTEGAAGATASVEMNVRVSSGVQAPAGTRRETVVPTWAPQPLRVRAGLWLYGVLLAWLITSLLLVCRLAFAYRAMVLRCATVADAPGNLGQCVAHWQADRLIRRGGIRVVLSDRTDTPLAIGFGTPVIVLPAIYPQQFSNEDLEQMCLHEAAHLARRDDATLFIQRFISALFPWHPAVRWISGQLDLEREIACDDYVVNANGQVRAYASCLTRVAELGGAAEAVLTSPTVIGNKSDLARRIDALLETRRSVTARLLRGRFVVLATLLVGVALLSSRIHEMFAFAQAGQLLGLPPRVQTVADAALGTPPELTADVLLLLVERGYIVEPKQKRQAVENAWDLAPRAKHPHEIVPAVNGMSTESAVAALSAALRPGLSTAGLQLRAITQMATLDAQRARTMFAAMTHPEPEPLNCSADHYASHVPYFNALELSLGTFSAENARRAERTAFFKDALRYAANNDDLRLSLALLRTDKTLTESDFVDLLNQWSETLGQVRFTDRVYSANSLLALSDPVIEAARQIKTRGGSSVAPLSALRSYIVRHAMAIRCEDGPGRRQTTGPGQARPANNEETARLAFNAAVTELAPEILPIKPEEIVPAGKGGKAVVTQYINWFSEGDQVPPDVARFRQLSDAGKKLRFGTPEQLAANTQRMRSAGSPNIAAMLTIEERSTPEWNTQAFEYLGQLENWSRDLTQSNVEVFFQKAYFYGSLLAIVPDGKLRDTLLRSYVTFLATSPAKLESPPEWVKYVNELIETTKRTSRMKDVRDQRQWLDQIEAAGDNTIGVYCKLARLSLDSEK